MYMLIIIIIMLHSSAYISARGCPNIPVATTTSTLYFLHAQYKVCSKLEADCIIQYTALHNRSLLLFNSVCVLFITLLTSLPMRFPQNKIMLKNI